MKKLKGIISDWRQEDNRIVGKCVWHADAVPIGRGMMSPDNKIAAGHGMYTSEIVHQFPTPVEGMEIVETLNSLYILTSRAV